jgi:uncharacterized protein YrrD
MDSRTLVLAMSPKTTLKFSELLGKPVIDCKTSDELGQIEQLWLNPKTHQIEGATCRSGLMGLKKRHLTWSHIESIGADSVVVSIPTGVEPTRPDWVECEIGQAVYTDTGDRIGAFKDYYLDAETGDVLDYLFVSTGLRSLIDGLYRLPASAIVSLGSQRLIVMETALQTAEREGGLSQTVTQVGEYLKDDYARTQQDLTSALQGTKAMATQVQEKTQQLASQAKDTLTDRKSALPSQPAEPTHELPPALGPTSEPPQNQHPPE